MHSFALGWLPILAFAATYILSDLRVATMVLIGTATALWLWFKLRRRPLSKTDNFSVIALWLFGGLTLAFSNPIFIMLKPTIVYLVMASVLLINLRVGKQALLKKLFAKFYQFPDSGWRAFQETWALFFTFLASANLFVAYNFSESVWVQYKLFGNLIIFLLMILLQSWFLRHHIIEYATKSPTHLPSTEDDAMEESLENIIDLVRHKLADLQCTVCEIEDVSLAHQGHAGNTGGAHLVLTLVSDKFAGLSLFERERLVADRFKSYIPDKIHALSVRNYTPEEHAYSLNKTL